MSALVAAAPEVQPLVDEHLVDYDGILLHLLMADLGRRCVQAAAEHDTDLLRRVLGVLDRALKEGTDEVVNAVAVSFVEDSWLDRRMAPVVAAFPPSLRDEMARQRNS